MHNPYPYVEERCTKDITPIAVAIRRFIEAVNEYAGGWIGLSSMPNDEPPRTAWAESHDSEQLTTMAIRAAHRNVEDGWGVHLNVCPRRGRPAGGRGGDSTILCWPALWVDLDAKSDQALAALRAFSPEPSIIVASGSAGHYHAYWLLLTPEPHGEQVARINASLATVFPGGDGANGRPSSMIRVAGTWNTKREPRTLSTVVQWSYDKLYRLRDFEWLDPGKQVARPQAARVEESQPERQVVTAAQVAEMCHNVKSYHGGFIASCPCRGHGKGKGDTTPSLTIRQGDKGVLIKCFGGCDIQDIAAALGLPMSALFSDHTRPATRAETLAMWAHSVEHQERI